MTASLRLHRRLRGAKRRRSQMVCSIRHGSMTAWSRRAQSDVRALQAGTRLPLVGCRSFVDQPDRSVVLKLSVEGAAGDCLLSVPPETPGRFEAPLVDLAADAPQTLEQIFAHVTAAGFELEAERELVCHFALGTTR